VVLLVPFFSVNQAAGQVTVIHESTYPWLVRGAYANYVDFPVGEIPYFVTTNGTLLLGFAPVGNGTVLPKPPGGHASLNWTVTNREGDTVWLEIGFHAYGCDYSYQQVKSNGNCTSYNFSTSLGISVNLTTNEAYVNGQPEGLLNFWEPPLLNGGTLDFSTAFVGGEPFTVVGHAGAPGNSSMILGLPTNGINDTGVVYDGPYDAYFVGQATFGTGPDSQFGWENVTGALGGPQLFSLDPRGAYDYWNGLAYEFSIPSYPLNRTVCSISSGKAVGCQYTSYATTLGNYFRSGIGELGLVSTNIPLGPSQTSETSTLDVTPPPFFNQYVVIPIITIVAVALASFFLVVKRRGR
jgi:hypothetical protein